MFSCKSKPHFRFCKHLLNQTDKNKEQREGLCSLMSNYHPPLLHCHLCILPAFGGAKMCVLGTVVQTDAMHVFLYENHINLLSFWLPMLFPPWLLHKFKPKEEKVLIDFLQNVSFYEFTNYLTGLTQPVFFYGSPGCLSGEWNHQSVWLVFSKVTMIFLFWCWKVCCKLLTREIRCLQWRPQFGSCRSLKMSDRLMDFRWKWLKYTVIDCEAFSTLCMAESLWLIIMSTCQLLGSLVWVKWLWLAISFTC